MPSKDRVDRAYCVSTRSIHLAAMLWIASLLLGCIEQREPEPQINAAIQAVTPTCVTIQSAGNVSVTDAAISVASPTKNFNAESMPTGNVGGSERQGLVRFDLTSIPAGATVVSATARLTVLQGSGSVRVHRATAAWVDSAVTWQSFNGAYLAAVEGTLSGSTTTYSADLTALTQGWVSGSFSNHGVLLERDLTGSTTFISSNYTASAAARPRLDVCYTADPCAGQPDGASCSDGNPCNGFETCQQGACTAGTPVTCTAQDACHDVGTCNQQTGQCTNPPKPNGTSCADADACNGAETCQSGTCTAGTPVTCFAQDVCHDVGTCNQQTGLCTNPLKPNGTSCSDGNPCNGTETCQAGACAAGTPVTCTAPDACHSAGACNPQTGLCTNPVKPNGSACDSGNPCSGYEVCQQGACTCTAAQTTCVAVQLGTHGSVADATISLPSPTKNYNGETLAVGNVSGERQTLMRFDLASIPANASVTSATISLTLFQGGGALRAHRITAPWVDSTVTWQSFAGAYLPAVEATLVGSTVQTADLGALTQAWVDGSVPNHGVLLERDLTASSVYWSSNYTGSVTAHPRLDVCYTTPFIDPCLGQPDGTPCNDGDACTQVDVCQSGACHGTSPVTCTAFDQCHAAGTCNPADGTCSNPPKADGTACNDGNPCTQNDTCVSGACVGGMDTCCQAVAGSSSPATAAPMTVPPELPDVTLVDRDGNRVDDLIDSDLAKVRAEIAAAHDTRAIARARQRLDEPIRVEAIFKARTSGAEQRLFVREGGTVDYAFQALSYGFTGRIPRSAAARIAARLGPDLLLLGGDHPVKPHLDEATATGRVRPVWAANFAGYPAGWSGSSTTTIGILDSGIDDSHADLTQRAVYWRDFTSEGFTCPVDNNGHGTHVAGIALGTGAAFGVGPGTLRFTDSGTLVGVSPGSFYPSSIHLPQTLLTFTAQATWQGGGITTLHVMEGLDDDYAFGSMGSAQGTSPLTVAWTFNPQAARHYTSGLEQASSGAISNYAVANAVSGYPAVGDGFNALRGVAPGCKWAGAKVFTQAATGSWLDVEAALDDLVAQRVSKNIKILNLSLGAVPDGSPVPSVRAKVNTAVMNGVVVVVSAGNGGPFLGMSDPARASLVITAGAANDANQVTSYTSNGFASPGADEDNKPDLLAPGGSRFRSPILSADSNDSDARTSTFADVAHDDYANLSGTSMAAPFVSGAAALVIQAFEASGGTWGFASSSQPLFVKMLLCASATETNQPREAATGGDPTLGRAAAPKDLYEGYGMMNPDAAVEALSLAFTGGSFNGTTTGAKNDRRAWARKLSFTAGHAWNLSLTTAATADYDVYLISATPNAKGNPVILAASTNGGLGAAETLSYTPAANGTGYLFVKRVSGNGAFTLAGGPVP